jgi:hypothetical protein
MEKTRVKKNKNSVTINIIQIGTRRHKRDREGKKTIVENWRNGSRDRISGAGRHGWREDGLNRSWSVWFNSGERNWIIGKGMRFAAFSYCLLLHENLYVGKSFGKKHAHRAELASKITAWNGISVSSERQAETE